MFILFPILFAMTVAHSPRTMRQYRTDYVYNRKTDAFYKLHIESVWNNRAQSVCNDEGGQLMVPTSNQDVTQLHAMVKEYPDIGDYIWIGIDGLAHESAEEQPIINLQDPNDMNIDVESIKGLCNVMTRDGDTMTYHCYFRAPFICKVDAKNIHHDTQCNVFVDGYKYYKSVGSCYKISHIASSWSEAYDSCLAEGSHLAVLNSVAEQQIIYNITNSALPVHFAQTSWFFLVGVKARKTTGDTLRVFRTVFNQTLEEAGFNEWSPGEPNNALGSEYCGSIFKNDGKLNDVDCSHAYAYICEKEIQTAGVSN